MGGRIFKELGGPVIGSVKRNIKDNQNRIKNETRSLESRPKDRTIKPARRPFQKIKRKQTPKPIQRRGKPIQRKAMMGGGMTMMPRAMYKKGGKSFPDLSGDGKVTMKDILMGRGVIKRPNKKGGGLMEATSRLRAQGLKMGGIARGCGAVMSDRRKKTKMY